VGLLSIWGEPEPDEWGPAGAARLLLRPSLLSVAPAVSLLLLPPSLLRFVAEIVLPLLALASTHLLRDDRGGRRMSSPDMCDLRHHTCSSTVSNSSARREEEPWSLAFGA
jgi:hypothetical protein